MKNKRTKCPYCGQKKQFRKDEESSQLYCYKCDKWFIPKEKQLGIGQYLQKRITKNTKNTTVILNNS